MKFLLFEQNSRKMFGSFDNVRDFEQNVRLFEQSIVDFESKSKTYNDLVILSPKGEFP